MILTKFLDYICIIFPSQLGTMTRALPSCSLGYEASAGILQNLQIMVPSRLLFNNESSSMSVFSGTQLHAPPWRTSTYSAACVCLFISDLLDKPESQILLQENANPVLVCEFNESHVTVPLQGWNWLFLLFTLNSNLIHSEDSFGIYRFCLFASLEIMNWGVRGHINRESC